MLRISNLSLSRGVKLLLDKVSLTVHPGHRVGLIGANGSGKSSLFALLRGELSQDQGELSTPPGWVIAHVAQETAPVAGTAIDYVLDGDRELRGVERALAAAQADEAADTHTGASILPNCTIASRSSTGTAHVREPPRCSRGSASLPGSTIIQLRRSPAAGGCASTWRRR